MVQVDFTERGLPGWALRPTNFHIGKKEEACGRKISWVKTGVLPA